MGSSPCPAPFVMNGCRDSVSSVECWLRVLDQQPRPGPRRCTGVGYFDYDHGTPTSPGQSTNVGTGIDKQASSGSTVVNDMESPPISASHTSEQPTTVDATVEKAMVADEAAEFFPTPTVANKEVVGLGTAAPASPTLQQAGAVANP
ncbi:hypothetical protein V6N13_019801 [Hibiscus sabdariffa]